MEYSEHTATRPKKSSSTCNCLERLSSGIVWGLETFFYRLGKLVARNPFPTIIACFVVCGVCGVGLKDWREENEYVKVWLPRTSRMIEEHDWVQRNFPQAMRVTSVILENDNILTSRALQVMLDLYLKAQRFRLLNNESLANVCIKAGPFCRTQSILELWHYNETAIRLLTSADIVTMVNSGVSYSPMYGTELDLDQMLGNIQRDTEGRIVGAEATTMIWFLERHDESKEVARDWELQMINEIADASHPDLRNLYIYTPRTFNDEAVGALSADLVLLSAGFGLVLVFVVVCISSYSFVQHKIYVALAGVSSIALAIAFSYGLGLWTGIMFGPIHQIMPFMLLGIGVDDMFVIVEALKHLSPEEKKLSVEERIGLTLKKAGVSITVTSITDIVAFGIGGTTVIPALSTFCVYAALGVFALYILQATYFVACLTLDQRRIQARRDACCLCFTHTEDYTPNKYHDFSVEHTFMEKFFGPFLNKLPVKVVVIIVALGLVGVNLWSVTKLKPEFDFANYLPSDSYSTDFVLADRKLFPDDGTFALVYCDDVDVYRSHRDLENMYEILVNRSDIQGATADFWLTAFRRWLTNMANDTHVASKLDSEDFPENKTSFYQLLPVFLVTKSGRAYRRFLRLDNDTAPAQVQASAFTFRHVKFAKSNDAIESMDSVRELVDSHSFPNGGSCFAYGNQAYMFSETNKVLNIELYRNLALAAVCVFLVTLVLIANIWTGLLVFLCVVCTVVDVAGALQFWGVTIDTASSVLLILCFGLAVDYSAHVGHTFMTVAGTKNERARKTLTTIGPAVFNGGFSTFLAFILLVRSTTYGFTLFFRTFTLVVTLGLFHGLTVLPVVLSLIGPRSYKTQTASQGQDKPHSNGVIGRGSRRDKNDDRWRFYNGAFKEEPMQTIDSDVYRDTCTAQYQRKESAQFCYEQMSNGSLILIPPPDYTPPSPRRPLHR